MNKDTNAEAQGGLILSSTMSIPCGTPKLSQGTGPRATYQDGPLISLSQFSTTRGPQTFFASPPIACAYRRRGLKPVGLTSYSLLPAGATGVVHSPRDERTFSFPHRTWPLPRPVGYRCRLPGCQLRLGGGHR